MLGITGLGKQQGLTWNWRGIPPHLGLVAQHRKNRVITVLSLVMSLAMVSVIVLSLAVGVGLGYAIIFGILYVFDRSRHVMKPAPAQILTTSAGND